jgi:hypothetical protein
MTNPSTIDYGAQASFHPNIKVSNFEIEVTQFCISPTQKGSMHNDEEKPSTASGN